jgi:hypothetical protein
MAQLNDLFPALMSLLFTILHHVRKRIIAGSVMTETLFHFKCEAVSLRIQMATKPTLSFESCCMAEYDLEK